MINIFIWSAVVYKCEHFHGDAAACRAAQTLSITAGGVRQPSQRPQPTAQQEPRHTCRLYCISSHCTQSSVSCTTAAPIFPHQFSCVGQNLRESAFGIALKGENVYGIFVTWCLCFCLVPHPGLVIAAFSCGDGRSAESFVVEKKSIYNKNSDER